MNYMIDILLNLTLTTLLLSSLLFFCDKKNRIYIWLLLLISSLNELGLRLGSYVMRPLHFYWNWGGKILSILVSITFLMLLQKLIKTISLAEYKITFKQHITGKKTILLVLFFMLILVMGNLTGQKSKFAVETILFQLTMPGIDEELSFRGIYLTLLDKAFVKRFKLLDCEFGWGLIVVSILFGLSHGVNISLSNGFHFDAVNFAATGLLGFGFGLLAEASKSLVLPTIAHNTFNTLGYLIRVFKR